MCNRIPNQTSECDQITKQTIFRIKNFSRDRNWDQFHNPKDLAISISLEASELLECFQWSAQDLIVDKNRDKLIEETADVLIYALRLCQILKVNPDDIVNRKLDLNELKYPIKNAYGKSDKYTDIQNGSQQENNS